MISNSGKISQIINNQTSNLYDNVPKYFSATRYHSLIIEREALHEDLIISAWLNDGTIMGIEHKTAPLYGVQYHPESIETKHGIKIIENFVNIV